MLVQNNTNLYINSLNSINTMKTSINTILNNSDLKNTNSILNTLLTPSTTSRRSSVLSTTLSTTSTNNSKKVNKVPIKLTWNKGNTPSYEDEKKFERYMQLYLGKKITTEGRDHATTIADQCHMTISQAQNFYTTVHFSGKPNTREEEEYIKQKTDRIGKKCESAIDKLLKPLAINVEEERVQKLQLAEQNEQKKNVFEQELRDNEEQKQLVSKTLGIDLDTKPLSFAEQQLLLTSIHNDPTNHDNESLPSTFHQIQKLLKPSKDFKSERKLTPDYIINDELYINGHLIKWIEIKSFYGVGTEQHSATRSEEALKKCQRYYENFGEGAIIFGLGYGENFQARLPKGVIALDKHTWPKEFTTVAFTNSKGKQNQSDTGISTDTDETTSVTSMMESSIRDDISLTGSELSYMEHTPEKLQANPYLKALVTEKEEMMVDLPSAKPIVSPWLMAAKKLGTNPSKPVTKIVPKVVTSSKPSNPITKPRKGNGNDQKMKRGNTKAKK